MTSTSHGEGTPSEIDPETGLPIGPRVEPGPARFPERVSISGRYARLEPLGPEHLPHLFEASNAPQKDAGAPSALGRMRYLVDTPPKDLAELEEWLANCECGETRVGYAVVDRSSERTEGRFFLMRINEAFKTIEVGNVFFGPALSRTRAATEAVYLLARYAFEELGYRRFEWKCDSLNAPSRRAALRFGFRFEGIFRRDVIIKGRSRDTAWFAIIDEDWPSVRAGFERWLDPANFDGNGAQRAKLEDLRAPL